MSIFFPAAAAVRTVPAAPDEVLIALRGDRVILSGAGRLEFGRLDGAACSLVGEENLRVPETFREIEVRFAFTVLPEPEQIAVCRARTLANWRRNRRFCGACGLELVDLADECARKCPGCGAVFYPQISPAVIVAVTDAAGRLLLAHNGKFREGLYSLVAGFVEPGESMESAVHREIREEVGGGV